MIAQYYIENTLLRVTIMGKLDCVTHNFSCHLKSGLCGLIQNLYIECKRNRYLSTVYINLFSDQPLPIQLVGSRKLIECITQVKLKFTKILLSSTGLKISDIDSVSIFVDFHFGEPVTINKQDMMSKIRVWYGYDPIYDMKIKILTTNGIEKVKIIQNR
jgi:hypothetical protein